MYKRATERKVRKNTRQLVAWRNDIMRREREAKQARDVLLQAETRVRETGDENELLSLAIAVSRLVTALDESASETDDIETFELLHTEARYGDTILALIDQRLEPDSKGENYFWLF